MLTAKELVYLVCFLVLYYYYYFYYYYYYYYYLQFILKMVYEIFVNFLNFFYLDSMKEMIIMGYFVELVPIIETWDFIRIL